MCTDFQMRGIIILKDFEDGGDTEMFEEFAPYLYAQHQHKKKSALTAAEKRLVKLKKQAVTDRLITRSLGAQLTAQKLFDNEPAGSVWTGVFGGTCSVQMNGNPVANLIHQLDLARNRVAVLLCVADEEGQDGLGGDGTGEEDKKAHIIWIYLSISAIANAREIYTKAIEKLKQATEATDKVIARTEKNTMKIRWRSSKQNATRYISDVKRSGLKTSLVEAIFTQGDYFVHADLHAYAHSSAWSNQIIAGAYWVHADQASKTAPWGIEERALLTSDGIDEAERGMGGKDVYSDGNSTEKVMSMTDKCTVILQTLKEKVIDNERKM
ncbi:hypothetical protein Plhal703r1_c18g0082361 [Plasmopara halstedii]